jgi:signal transduction histidine kinase
VQQISLANSRIIDLVESFLRVSRAEAGRFPVHPEIVDLEKFMNTSVAELLPVFSSKGITVEKVFQPGVPTTATIDTRLLGVVVSNLLSNAVNYGRCGGRIRFSIGPGELSKDIHPVKRFFYPGSILLTVADDGTGIPSNAKPFIFNKLFCAYNAQKLVTTGNGLGLYLTKRLVSQIGGHIWFDSPALKVDIRREGNVESPGAAFHVLIPGVWQKVIFKLGVYGFATDRAMDKNVS